MESPFPAPKGPVQEVKWEEFGMVPGQGDKALVLKRSIVVKYDDQQHEIERTEEGSQLHARETTTAVWRDGRIQSQEFARQTAPGVVQRSPQPSEWNRWSYDSSGHVIDFKVGAGSNLETHYLNYSYDAQGRVVSWDCREGADDKRFSSTKIIYTGKTIESTVYDANNHKTDLQVQATDAAGRVVDLQVSDLSGSHLKLWYHSKFKYDGEGRVIEQVTDPYDFGEGSDYAPMPGRFVAQYDDAHHTVDQKFYESKGKLAFHGEGRLDGDGLLIALREFDGLGKEGTGSDSVLNPMTGKMEEQKGSVTWEVVYDDHGNWTERKRWFAPADSGPRILVQMVQQSITYRKADKP